MARECARPVRRKVAGSAAALSACAWQAFFLAPAGAEQHEINTRGSQWAPVVLFIEPGDSIVFRGMDSHETELIEGMGPEGAVLWRSELDEEGFTVTLDVPGAYVYKCHVHMNAGMVGAVVVGDAHNLAALKAAVSEVETGRPFVQRVLGRLERELRRRGAL